MSEEKRLNRRQRLMVNFCKKREGLSWNQLLLGPISDAHGLELPSAGLKVKPTEPGKSASKPKTKKTGKGKAKKVEEVEEETPAPIGDPIPDDVPGEE